MWTPGSWTLWYGSHGEFIHGALQVSRGCPSWSPPWHGLHRELHSRRSSRLVVDQFGVAGSAPVSPKISLRISLRQLFSRWCGAGAPDEGGNVMYHVARSVWRRRKRSRSAPRKKCDRPARQKSTNAKKAAEAAKNSLFDVLSNVNPPPRVCHRD